MNAVWKLIVLFIILIGLCACTNSNSFMGLPAEGKAALESRLMFDGFESFEIISVQKGETEGPPIDYDEVWCVVVDLGESGIDSYFVQRSEKLYRAAETLPGEAGERRFLRRGCDNFRRE